MGPQTQAVEARAANPPPSFAGKEHTPEVRAKISAGMKGRAKSPEHRAKLAAAQKGRKRTAEHKAAMSAGMKAKYAEGWRPV